MKLKSNSGVALLLVLVSLMLLSVVIYEISGSSRVELSISRNSRDRLQAFLLAQSGARFALLRLYIYKEVQNLIVGGVPVPIQKGVENQIWAGPLPPFPFPGSKSEWPGQLVTQIESEGSKIPINLLDAKTTDDKLHRDSTLEKATSVKEQLTNLLQSLKDDEDDETFKDIEPEELVSSLVDWIDDDSLKSGVEGGDENGDYEDAEPAYKPRNDRIPTLSEMHMIKGWTDELLRIVQPQLSVTNMSLAMNPNFIPISRLKALNPRFSKEDLLAIEKRRREGLPFSSMDDLENFIRTSPDIKNGLDFTFPASLKQTSSSRETFFTIKSTGVVGDSRRNLKIALRFDEEAQKSTSSPPPNPPKPGKLKEPNLVFVEETP